MSKTVHFSELGLANTREMFARAMAGGYAIPAYNFNNMEQLQAIIKDWLTLARLEGGQLAQQHAELRRRVNPPAPDAAAERIEILRMLAHHGCRSLAQLRRGRRGRHSPPAAR